MSLFSTISGMDAEMGNRDVRTTTTTSTLASRKEELHDFGALSLRLLTSSIAAAEKPAAAKALHPAGTRIETENLRSAVEMLVQKLTGDRFRAEPFQTTWQKDHAPVLFPPGNTDRGEGRIPYWLSFQSFSLRMVHQQLHITSRGVLGRECGLQNLAFELQLERFSFSLTWPDRSHEISLPLALRLVFFGRDNEFDVTQLSCCLTRTNNDEEKEQCGTAVLDFSAGSQAMGLTDCGCSNDQILTSAEPAEPGETVESALLSDRLWLWQVNGEK